MSTTVSATTDRISLVGLSARGHHGVLPFEREEGQLFTVDVILDLGQRGTAVAAVTDSVTDAVDYSRVANGIVSIIEGEPVNLIESLADRIAERVLSFPRVVAAEVTVHKPEAPLDVAFEDVSVTIHRVADAAAGHGGAPATSQAAWAAQGLHASGVYRVTIQTVDVGGASSDTAVVFTCVDQHDVDLVKADGTSSGDDLQHNYLYMATLDRSSGSWIVVSDERMGVDQC